MSHLDIQELVTRGRSLSKISEHVAYMNVFQPKMLGTEGHEMALFIQGLITDNMAELGEAVAA